MVKPRPAWNARFARRNFCLRDLYGMGRRTFLFIAKHAAIDPAIRMGMICLSESRVRSDSPGAGVATGGRVSVSASARIDANISPMKIEINSIMQMPNSQRTTLMRTRFGVDLSVVNIVLKK